MRTKQTGFTLIELVSVIVILGIIAAVAVPRFLNLTTQARVAALNGMAGAVRSAAALAHAQALALGQNPSSTTTSNVTMEGQTISMLYTYPDGTATGIMTAVSSSGFDTATAGTFTLKDSAGAAITGCNVVYTPATATGTAPNLVVTPPSAAVNTGGC